MNYRRTKQKGLRELKLAVAAAAAFSGSGPASRTSDVPSTPTPSPASCFLEAFGYDARNVTPATADSTVMIIRRRDTGSMSLETLREGIQGSGAVVANSFGLDGLNRIVTAQHVANPSDGRDGYLIYKSNGDFIGTAEIVATGGYKASKTTLVSYDVARKDGIKDAAVLAMTSFGSPAMEQEYRSVPGFKLAPPAVNQ